MRIQPRRDELSLDRVEAYRVTVRFGVGPTLYAIATLAALVASRLSLALFVFMAIFYMLPVTGSAATSE